MYPTLQTYRTGSGTWRNYYVELVMDMVSFLSINLALSLPRLSASLLSSVGYRAVQ